MLNRYKHIVVILACLFSVNAFAQPDEIPVRMKLYYLDFATSPYGATSKERFEQYEAAYKIWFHGKHKFISGLQEKLELHKSKARLNNDILRLKAVIFNNGSTKTYYVDKSGTVQNENTNESFKLTESEIENLHEEIMQYRGVVDQRPQVDVWGQY